MTHLLAICNPENRRTTLLARAARQAGWRFERFDYRSLLEDFDRSLPSLARRTRRAAVVRLDSPAEDPRVERLLLRWGLEPAAAEGAGHASQRHIDSLTPDHGRILFPRQQFLGYAALLQRLERGLPAVRWMNSPSEVLAMFDKPTAARRLRSAGKPMPPGGELVSSFDELVELAESRCWGRVFVKLANGSSASGVAALTLKPQLHAVSSVELAGAGQQRRMYNSLVTQHYQGIVAVRDLVDSLAPHRLIVEQWLPKAAVQAGGEFDLRVVVTAGRPSHFVVRVSRGSPMTNLHLGNRRGGLAEVRGALGDDRWEGLFQACREAADAFPEAHYAGLDVMLSPDLEQLYFLECNAYGDLIPGIVDEFGLSTHERQLRDWPLAASRSCPVSPPLASADEGRSRP